MATLKALAIAVAVVGSTSLVLAQNGPPTPTNAPAPGASVSTNNAGKTVHTKKSHRLYNMSHTSKTSKKKLHMTTTPSKS
jgi:hypothetical protein